MLNKSRVWSLVLLRSSLYSLASTSARTHTHSHSLGYVVHSGPRMPLHSLHCPTLDKAEGARHGANPITGPNTSLFKRNPSELYPRHYLGVLVLLLVRVQFKLLFGDVTSFGPSRLHYHLTWLFPLIVVPFGKFLAACFFYFRLLYVRPVPSLAACMRGTGNSNPVRKSAKWSSVRCVALGLIWLT